MADHCPAPCLTVVDVARRYRVSPDKVRAWIARGELAAVNTASALCGKPRWVVTPDALAAFERRRAGGLTKAPRRKRKASGCIDYYPDANTEDDHEELRTARPRRAGRLGARPAGEADQGGPRAGVRRRQAVT